MAKADGLERRARAVRAVVFMTRLFEYECRDLGLSMAQYRMLLYLRVGPKRAGQLAAQAAITRPSLSSLLVQLDKQELITRTAVDDDGRGVEIALSRKGLRAIRRVENRFGELFDDASAGCDRPRLLEALDELARELNHQIEARVHL